MPPSILILSSLSDTAEHVLQTAAILTAPLRPHLRLLHHCTTPGLAPELAGVLVVDQTTDQARAAGALQAMARHLPSPLETTVVATVEDLPEAVTNAVRHCAPLLLAMGLSPEPTLPDQLLRNQVLPILRGTHRPLLLIPHNSQLQTLPRRIAIAVDAEPFVPNDATRQAAQLLRAWQAAATVVHIVAPGERQAFPGQRALASVHQSGLLPDQPLALYEESGVAAAAGILQAVADTQAEVLVLIARPRSFLGSLFHRSVTARVLRQATVPVLLLPAAGPQVPAWMPELS